MASQRKIRTVARRASERAAIKQKEKLERKIASEKKQSLRSFRKGIKDALGFDDILNKLKKKVDYTFLTGK